MQRFILSSLAALILAGSVTVVKADDPLAVGFIFGGQIRKHGWTFQHNEGRLAVEAILGDQVRTGFVEVQPDMGDDVEGAIRQFAADGYNPIFISSFGFTDETLKVAKDYPDTNFEIATGTRRAENVGTFSARFYEGRYVIGRIAGGVTKTNVIGYIASKPIPEVNRGINAFTLGLQSVNPDAIVKVVWTDDWFDEDKESLAAKALIEAGADVLVQHTNSRMPLLIAEERGLFAFGQGSDLYAYAPNAHLTAIVNNWGPYYIERIRAVMEGRWQSTDSWAGFAAGAVKIARLNSDSLNQSVIDDVYTTIEEIRSGSVHPFTGPIIDQAGNQVIGADEILSDSHLLGMKYYVNGVEELVVDFDPGQQA